MGGRAYVDVVFDEYGSRMIPEAIIRGVQWEISEQFVSPDEILSMLSHAAIIQAQKQDKEKKEAEERNEIRACLPVRNPLLIPVKNSGKSSHAMGAKNLKIELERFFKGVKFSVRSESYSGGDSIHVSWVDGPLTEDVEKISSKYQEGHFDGMEDIYNYDKSNVWPDVFGGAKYVSESRRESRSLVTQAAKELGHVVTPEMFDKWGNLEGPFDFETQQQIYRQARQMRGEGFKIVNKQAIKQNKSSVLQTILAD